MKRVAVVLTASLALALAACAVEKPAEVSAPRAEITDGASSNQRQESAGRAGLPPGPLALSDATRDAQAAVELAPGEEAQPARDESVRDAKEAAEDAARKIVDVTREAANKIKEVGLDAVQSVRNSASFSNDESGSAELAANDERDD